MTFAEVACATQETKNDRNRRNINCACPSAQSAISRRASTSRGYADQIQARSCASPLERAGLRFTRHANLGISDQLSPLIRSDRCSPENVGPAPRCRDNVPRAVTVQVFNQHIGPHTNSVMHQLRNEARAARCGLVPHSPVHIQHRLPVGSGS
jgi:hypothetical protein